MKKRILSMAMAVLVAGGLFAGCGQRGTAEKESSSNSSVSEAETVSSEEVIDPMNDEINLAVLFVQKDTNSLNWEEGIANVCNNFPNGNVNYTVFDAQGSVETQVQQIAEAVNQEYDAILIHIADTAATATALEEAIDAGIGVYALNLLPDTPVTCWLGGDSTLTGSECAKDAVEQLNGEGKCVLIACPVALATMVKGHEGFEEVATAGGLEVLETQNGDWTVENGNQIARDFLAKYDNDIQVIWCQNDQMAIGAAQAVEAAGLTGQVLIYGSDGTEEAIQYIKDGKMRGSCAFDNVLTGENAANVAIYNLQTGYVDPGENTAIMYNMLTMITPDNAEEYALTHGMEY